MFCESIYCYDTIDAVENSEGFFEASKKGNLIPLYRCILSDHLTPVLAYRCLVKEDDREAPSFLFESVEPGVMGSNIVRALVLVFLLLFLDLLLCALMRCESFIFQLGKLCRGGIAWLELSRQ